MVRKNGRWHRWTQEEEDIVRREYEGTRASKQRIAAKIGVTEHAVSGRISRLGLAKRSDRYRWDPKDDDLIRAFLPTMTVDKLAKLLGCSVNAVSIRANRLGLSRRHRAGWYTKSEVCEIVGMGHRWVQARIDRGELVATFHNGVRPGKAGLSMWHIKEKDLRAFIRSNAHELNGRNVDIIQVVDILAGLTPP